MARGEVADYTQVFDRTRHAALQRIVLQAKMKKANAVIGIQTSISQLFGTHEMILVGTASHHPALEGVSEPITSDMTNEEMWNMVHIGYMPVKLVMGVSVYSLGISGRLGAFLQTLGGGNVSGLTELLYEARQKALARIEIDCEKCGADKVIGVKTVVYDLGGGLIEFMAIGTAVKKMEGLGTKSEALPPQAIIQDRETLSYVNETGSPGSKTQSNSSNELRKGPITIISTVVIVFFYILLKWMGK